MPPKASNNSKKQPNKKSKGSGVRTVTVAQHAASSEGRRLAYNAMQSSLGSKLGQNLTQLMATPKEANLVRMPTPDMPLVALLRADSVYNVTHNVGSPMGYDVGTVNYYLFGQVGRGLIYGPIVESQAYSYQFFTDYNWVNPVTGGLGAIFPLKKDAFVSVAGQTYTCTSLCDRVGAIAASSSLGTNRPLGIKDGRSWLWCFAGETITFQFFWSNNGGSTWTSTGGLTGSVTFEILTCDCGNDAYTSSNSSTYTTGTLGSMYYTIPINGYYAINASFTANGTLTVLCGYGATIGQNAGNFIYPMLTLPQVESAPECAQKCRRTACSLLITNTSAEISQQGNVIAARVRPEYVTGINKTTLMSLADKYTGKAKNGCYTYMDFSQGAERFEDCTDTDTMRATKSITYDLSWTEMVHVISITSPTPSTAANSYIVTLDAVIEFMTDKPQYSKLVSDGSFDHLIEARRINNMTPYFFENPLHMADITRRISQFWAQIRRYATPIGVGLSAAFPQAAPAIMPMARLMQT